MRYEGSNRYVVVSTFCFKQLHPNSITFNSYVQRLKSKVLISIILTWLDPENYPYTTIMLIGKWTVNIDSGTLKPCPFQFVLFHVPFPPNQRERHFKSTAQFDTKIECPTEPTNADVKGKRCFLLEAMSLMRNKSAGYVSTFNITKGLG